MGVQPKKSSRLFILVGVILTLMSMMGVYFIAKGSSKPAASGSVQVVVAARTIPYKTVFKSPADAATWLTTETVPANSLPTGSFSSVSAFAAGEMRQGKVFNSVTILPKEEVLGSMFTGLGKIRPGVDASLALQKNQVAVSITTTLVNEAGGGITAGDNVDLVASYLPNGGGGGGATEALKQFHPPSTQFVFQDLKVIAVGSWIPGESSSVAQSGNTMLTFSVSRRIALMIQHMKDFAGSWDLSVVLRSFWSSTQYSTSAVDGTWFFDKLRNDFEKH